MTILCLVRDTKVGRWAAFSDCLITSDLESQGSSLITPHRPNYGLKKTFGFSEVAVEEKIGFVDDQMLLGWAGNRDEAVQVRAKIKARGSDDEINSILSETENSYLLVNANKDAGYELWLSGRFDVVHSEGYDFIFAGSGGKILEGLKFTGRHSPLGNSAPNPVWAAMQAMLRFMSEEMAGQDSQFYSLRTGGHYRLFYPHPDGIRQFRYSVNHWVQDASGEPVVKSIVVPYLSGIYECFVKFAVKKDWHCECTNAIALAPLLQSPRKSLKHEFNWFDALVSGFADCTLHVCWTNDAHETFAVSFQEPRFSYHTIDGTTELVKHAHEDETINVVRYAFSRMDSPRKARD